MGISLFDFVINIVEAYIITSFLFGYFIAKDNFNRLYFIIITLLLVAMVTFLNIYVGYEGLITIGESLFFFFPMLLLFSKGSKIEKLYISFFIFELLTIVYTCTFISASFLYYNEVNIALVLEEHYPLLAISSKIILFLVTQSIVRFRRKINFNGDFKMMVVFVMVSISSSVAVICIENILYEKTFDINAASLSMVCLLIVNISVFISFYQIIKDSESKLKNEKEKRFLDYQKDLLETSREYFQKTAKLKHDLQHFSTYVKYLVESGEEQQALQEVKKYRENVNYFNVETLTSNELLNFILHSKVRNANEKGLSVFLREIEIESNESMEINLLTFIGSILDLAIKNSCNDDQITISIKESLDKFILKISALAIAEEGARGRTEI